MKNDRMNSIIMFYKDKLYFEPEFIGIKKYKFKLYIVFNRNYDITL